MTRRSNRGWVPWAAALLIVAGPVPGQQGEAVPDPPRRGTTDETHREREEVSATDETEELPLFEEETVVVVNRTEESIRDAPVAVSVVGREEIETSPVDNPAELLRRVPGMNVIQMSARDVNVSARTATGRNARSTLALVDGRTVYQDYFGFVLWDLLPVSFDDLAQVEVIRGPGSAIWGANAFTGVVNLVTKSPRELEGSRLRVAAGELSTFEVAGLHAGVREGMAYKVSGSHFTQDAYERPTTLPDGTPLPPYENEGTDQTRADLRVDWERAAGTFRLDAGVADSDGVMFTGLGPFDSETLRQGYLRGSYDRGGLRLSASVDVHESSFLGFLTPDRVEIDNRTLHLEGGHQRAIGESHLLVYGGSLRASDFDISLTPGVDDRQEAGVYLEDEIFLGDRWRVRVGARADWFDTFGWTASPRLGLVFHAAPGHTFRAAYNRAYIAPSLVENYLRFETSSAVTLPTGPYVFPILAVGNEDLDEQTLDAFDLGYTGRIGDRSTVTVSLYRNETRDLILFVPVGFYRPDDPPPGWPLPPEALATIPLPSLFSYRNLGELEEQGVEVGLEIRPRPGIGLFANYSWQDEPEVTQEGPVPIAINIPPEHRASAGGTFGIGRLSGSLGVYWVDEAFWADVPPFTGTTDSYTMVNASLSFELPWEGTSLSLQVTNLTDEEIQQHIFGDILSRKAVAEVRVRF